MLRLFFVTALAVLAQNAPPPMRMGVSVQMPVTSNAVAMAAADAADSQIVAITASGKLFWEVTPVTPQQVTDKAKDALAAQPSRRIFLKADARTNFSAVAEVLEALRKAGAEALVLLTSQRDASDSATYVLPKGLEIHLSRTGRAAAASTQATMFGDVVRAVDFCAGVHAVVVF